MRAAVETPESAWERIENSDEDSWLADIGEQEDGADAAAGHVGGASDPSALTAAADTGDEDSPNLVLLT